jgi:hypothetical protein
MDEMKTVINELIKNTTLTTIGFGKKSITQAE